MIFSFVLSDENKMDQAVEQARKSVEIKSCFAAGSRTRNHAADRKDKRRFSESPKYGVPVQRPVTLQYVNCKGSADRRKAPLITRDAFASTDRITFFATTSAWSSI